MLDGDWLRLLFGDCVLLLYGDWVLLLSGESPGVPQILGDPGPPGEGEVVFELYIKGERGAPWWTPPGTGICEAICCPGECSFLRRMEDSTGI